MLRSLLSLPFLSALVLLLAAIVGTEAWLHDYTPAAMWSRLPTTIVEGWTDGYKSEFFR